jgi:hypothetical protein
MGEFFGGWRTNGQHANVPRVKSGGESTNGATFTGSVEAFKDHDQPWSETPFAHESRGEESQVREAPLGRSDPSE